MPWTSSDEERQGIVASSLRTSLEPVHSGTRPYTDRGSLR